MEERKSKRVTLCAYVAGPLHLFAIKELMISNPLYDLICICLIHDKNSNTTNQLLNTASLIELGRMQLWVQRRGSISRIAQSYCHIFKTFLFSIKRDVVFAIPDFKNSFAHCLRRFHPQRRFILLDDGFATVVSYQKYISKEIYFPDDLYYGSIGKLKKLLYVGFSSSILRARPLEVFSIYSDVIGSPYIGGNALRYLRGQASNANIQLCHATVLFAGTKLTERGALSMDDEIAMMISIAKYWKGIGRGVVYYAKRTSSLNKLKLLSECGFKIIESDYPMELYPLVNKNFQLPSIICSFGSTVNQSMRMIYNGLQSVFVNVSPYTQRYESQELAMAKRLLVHRTSTLMVDL